MLTLAELKNETRASLADKLTKLAENVRSGVKLSDIAINLEDAVTIAFHLYKRETGIIKE